MQKALSDGVFPGAVLLAGVGKQVVLHAAYGVANLVTRQPVTTATVFDLASLTKPLATTLAIMRLYEQGRIGLEQPISSILPVFAKTDKRGATIAQLLSHTGGVPDYRPYYIDLSAWPPGERKARLRELLAEEPLLQPPGERSLYSDIGFMILEWVIETVSGRRLDHFLTEEIYAPLGIADSVFFIDLSRPAPIGSYAATERCTWRGRLLEAQVHDENAYVLGGIAGHAGLFGTARGVYCILAELLRAYHEKEGPWRFESRTVQRFFQRTGRADKALGFDMPAALNPSCGRFFSPDSIGHLGFTGTSFWVDLSQSVVVVILTNRVHPTRNNIAIRSFRPLIHDAISIAIQNGGITG
jgi:CubicO group peptidase (beta-lactamase class C family)